MKNHVTLWISAWLSITFLCAQETMTLDAAISHGGRYLNMTIPSRSKVAVLGFQSSAEALADYVNEGVHQALARNPLLTVVERWRLISLLRETGLGLSADMRPTAPEIARKLGAEVFVIGSFSQVGVDYHLSIQGVSVQNRQPYWSNSYRIKEDATLISLRKPPPQIAEPASSSPSAGNRAADSPFNPETCREVQTLSGHRGVIYGIAYSPEGSRIASGSYDGTVKLWDLSRGQEIKTFSGQGGNILSVAYSPDGRWISSGSTNSTIRIWEVETGTSRTLSGHSGFVRSLAYSPDGRRLVSGSGDKTVKIWDVQKGQELRTLRTIGGHTGTVYAVAYSPDGRWIISSSEDQTVMLWSADDGIAIRTLTGHKGPVYAVAWSPDGKRIISCSDDKTLKVWDAASGRDLWTLLGHTGSVGAAVYTLDGRWILSSAEDKTIRIWESENGRPVKSLSSGHSGMIRNMVYSPQGPQFSSCSDDKTIKIWRAE